MDRALMRQEDEDLHGRPWVSLVYLCFVFIPMAFWPNPPRSAFYATFVAIAVFLPLYFGFFRSANSRVRMALAFAVAGLGYALIPFNPGGNTFLIYAMALAASEVNSQAAVLAFLRPEPCAATSLEASGLDDLAR